MAPQDDDLLPENTSGYKLSQPKQSLAEYQKMGKSYETTWRCWLALVFGREPVWGMNSVIANAARAGAVSSTRAPR